MLWFRAASRVARSALVRSISSPASHYRHHVFPTSRFARHFQSKASKPTASRFLGWETLIPGMKEMFERAADLGVESITIGMSHRGRLNVLGNVVRKPLSQIFNEFSGGTKPVDELGLYTGTGDVKYHLGTSYDRPTRDVKRIHLSLVANPSHLEVVDPVVIGKTRAKQYYTNDTERTKNLAVLIHGVLIKT